MGDLGWALVLDGQSVRFEVAKYDSARTLVIDPTCFSTDLGGSDDDEDTGITSDASGNI